MDLAQPTDLRALLERHGVAANKRLGQHFLVSRRVVNAIVGALSGVQGVLEVGPGPGVLTRSMAETGTSVVAIELDSAMVPVLAESAPAARVVPGDALRLDLRALLSDLPTPRAIVSNMPYNVTGPLLERFADLRDNVSRMILMMQREVGDRILAPPGDRRRGALSVDLQYRFSIGRLCEAAAGAFWPPPKVDSVVLTFVPGETRLDDPEGLRSFVHVGFRQPRKTLANNFADGLGLERERVQSALARAGLPADVRPAVPTVADWVALRRALT